MLDSLWRLFIPLAKKGRLLTVVSVLRASLPGLDGPGFHIVLLVHVRVHGVLGY